MIEDLTGAIEISQRIEAPPDIVFAYLTDSQRFARWMGVGAELDPPRRLVMTWGWEGHPTVPPGSTTVEITLTPDRGATVLRLRHLGLPDEGERRVHTDGWERYTRQLAELVTTEAR